MISVYDIFLLYRLKGWNGDGNRCQFVSRQLLQNLMTIEENCIDVSFANSDPTKRSLLSIELLKHLQLSFNGVNQPEPVVKGTTISVFLVLLLNNLKRIPKIIFFQPAFQFCRS